MKPLDMEAANLAWQRAEAGGRQSATMLHMDRIGVRELRQHASRYLERVRHGETLEVTDRGRPVARLVPVSTDLWASLVASGKVTLAEDQSDLADEPPGNYNIEASTALMMMREHER